MRYKVNLHLHASDDPEDAIPHAFTDYVDRGAALGFRALALTCHNRFVNNPSYHAYAAERGMLFIPGAELTVEGAHVVVLNCDKEVEAVRTLAGLRAYKKNHPEICVIAPHPYFPFPYVLGEKLDRHIDLFDAIECSWFYSRRVDFNKRAEQTARNYRIPYLATSDTHDIRFLDSSYAEVEADKLSTAAILRAVKNGSFENRTSPRKLFREMGAFFAQQNIRNARASLLRRFGV